MKYHETLQLKDGRECVLRNGTQQDAQAVLDNFILTHRQTDYLLTYPDEMEDNQVSTEREAQFLKLRTESSDEIEMLAEVDGKVVGLAGIEHIGAQEKVKHRADFGVSVDQAYWGLGIGRALTRACIACAAKAGYSQLELQVVAENENAIRLYESEGFVTYGRNPRGFRSRLTGWQELVYMRIELDGLYTSL